MPPATRSALERLVETHLLVACVSGRAGDEAARLVGVDGIRYVGNHGLELHPAAESARADLGSFRRAAEGRWPVEDKGLTLSLHFREVPDEASARALLEEIASEAGAIGLDARWGRKVLEIRPRIDVDKGTAVAELLSCSGAKRAMYAGDDTTDIDAFRALDTAELEVAVKVAVDSPEAPAALLKAADVIVDGLTELAAELAALSRRGARQPGGAARPRRARRRQELCARCQWPFGARPGR